MGNLAKFCNLCKNRQLLRHCETGMLFAIKKILKSVVEEYQIHDQLFQEIRCLQLLNHPNIVKLYTGFTDEYHVFLVT
jgi:serine/threonine protein kinase